MTLGAVCEHGSLARSCEVCDLQRQLEAAQAHVTELKAQLDEANFEAARQRHACAEARCENESLRKQLTEACRQLALEQMP